MQVFACLHLPLYCREVVWVAPTLYSRGEGTDAIIDMLRSRLSGVCVWGGEGVDQIPHHLPR